MILPSDGKAARTVSPLPVLELGSPIGNDAGIEPLAFASIDVPGVESASSRTAEEGSDTEPEEEESLQAPTEPPTQSVSERLEEAIEAAMVRGRAQGRADAALEFDRQVSEVRIQILKCSDGFLRSREDYFASVEEQVIKLSLEIASHILQREVHVDPMALHGVANAALKRVMDESTTVLHVPLEDAENWRELFREQKSCVLEVRGESSLSSGECVLDTSLGRIDIGISAQLEEVEMRFFDQMQKRSA